MKIAILLGSADISGGTYVIFEHAIRMQRRGINITMITECPVRTEMLHWHQEARELNWQTYESSKDSSYDIVMATWWRTVYELQRIKGEKYAYFVQSIESKFYPDDEKTIQQLVEATYTLPLHIITEATWIQEYLQEKHFQKSQLVLNGIRKDIYQQNGPVHAPRSTDRLRVLVEGPLGVSFKNVEKTIALCKRSLADEIWLLTSTPIDDYSGVDRVFSQIPIHETPKVYRSCDVIVKLSYVEGMFGPPLEMFHCGGTAITYNVTGHELYIKNDVNAMVIPTDEEEKVVKGINRLKQEKGMLPRLKEGAEQTARQWPDWEDSSLEFEKALDHILAHGRPTPQEEIKVRTSFLFDFYVLAENYRQNSSVESRWTKSKKYLANHHPALHQQLRKLKWRIRCWRA